MKTILIELILLFTLSAQKYTFTNISGEFKNSSTGQIVKSSEIDNLTFENLGEGVYKMTDSKESQILQFSHMEDDLYVYTVIDHKSIVKSTTKLSLLAKGTPGKIIVYLIDTPITLTYTLIN
jgi:hypothetical protein